MLYFNEPGVPRDTNRFSLLSVKGLLFRAIRSTYIYALVVANIFVLRSEYYVETVDQASLLSTKTESRSLRNFCKHV